MKTVGSNILIAVNVLSSMTAANLKHDGCSTQQYTADSTPSASTRFPPQRSNQDLRCFPRCAPVTVLEQYNTPMQLHLLLEDIEPVNDETETKTDNSE